MGLEAATYINGLVATNPVGATDDRSTADDHLRLIKAVLKNSFPNLTGAVTGTETQLNNMVAYGLTNNTAASISKTLAFITTPVKMVGSNAFDLGPTYGGYFDASATAYAMPAGWTVARTAQGVYLVTHGLNRFPFTGGKMSAIANAYGSFPPRHGQVFSMAANTFEIRTFDWSLSAVDSVVNFIATTW